MNVSIIRRRGYRGGKKKEKYLRFNAWPITVISDVTHNSRMSYEFKIRYINFGGYSLKCSFWRAMNIVSSTKLEGSMDPNISYTPTEPFELGIPYVIKFDCQSNGNWKASLNDTIIATGSITSYSRGTGINVGYYDTSGSFGYLNADIAYIKLWNASGTLIKELVPKEVDGVCGFYDNVQGTFYGPTRGTFTIVE